MEGARIIAWQVGVKVYVSVTKHTGLRLSDAICVDGNAVRCVKYTLSGVKHGVLVAVSS